MSASTSVNNSPCHSTADYRKRTRSSHEDDNKDAKRMRYYYVLASESSSFSDDGTESIYSIQEKETDYVKDTTDTDTKSEMSDDYDIQVEYDVVSSSEEEIVYTEGSSSGNDDVLLAAGALAATLCEERSLDKWVTDGDDETDSAMSELDSKLHNQKCRMCRQRETVNCFPLCSHCFQIRKMYLPPRPRKSRPKIQHTATSSSSSQVTTDSLRSCLNGLSSQESGISSSQELQPLAWDKIIVPENLLSKSTDIASSQSSAKSSSDPVAGESSSSSESVLKSTDLSLLAKKTIKSLSDDKNSRSSLGISSFDDGFYNWNVATKELCIMCNERPKNGMFLHSTGGHMCCCYTCAVKYWKKSKRCAYCNRKVKNVVKAFVV